MKATRFPRMLALGLAALLALPGAGGETLSNADIVGMSRAGLSPELVIGKIQSEPNAFDLSTRAMIALRENGISNEVLQAMTLAAQRSSAQARLDQPRFRLELDNFASGGPEARAAGLAWLLANREQTLPALRRSLADARPEIRAGAALALARMGDRESLPPLRNLLTDAAPAVRAAAAQTLFEMNDVSAVAAAEQAVVRRLTPVDGYARLLGHARLTQAAGPLGLTLSGSPDAQGRAAAAWALGEIGRAGAAGRPALEQALAGDADPLVRREAAAAIAKLHDLRSAEALQEACRRDPGVRKIALEAMADYPETTEFLIGVMNLGADQIAPDELETAKASLYRLTGEDFGLNGQRWAAWFASAGRAPSLRRLAADAPAATRTSFSSEVDVAAWGIVADPSGIPMAPQADSFRPPTPAAGPGGVRLPLPSDFSGGADFPAIPALTPFRPDGAGPVPHAGQAAAPAAAEIPEFAPEDEPADAGRVSGFQTWSSEPAASRQPPPAAAAPERGATLRPPAGVVAPPPESASDADDQDLLRGLSLPMPPREDALGAPGGAMGGAGAAGATPAGTVPAPFDADFGAGDPFVIPEDYDQSGPLAPSLLDGFPEIEAGEPETDGGYLDFRDRAPLPGEAAGAEDADSVLWGRPEIPGETPEPDEGQGAPPFATDSGGPLGVPPPGFLEDSGEADKPESGGSSLFVDPQPGQIVLGEPLAAPAQPAFSLPGPDADDPFAAASDPYDHGESGGEDFPAPPPAGADAGVSVSPDWTPDAFTTAPPAQSAPDPEPFDPFKGSSLPPVTPEGAVQPQGGRGLPPLLGETLGR